MEPALLGLEIANLALLLLATNMFVPNMIVNTRGGVRKHAEPGELEEGLCLSGEAGLAPSFQAWTDFRSRARHQMFSSSLSSPNLSQYLLYILLLVCI